MPWTVSFAPDSDKETVGALTSTFTDGAEFATDPLVFSRRTGLDPDNPVDRASLQQYRTDAEAAVSAERVRRQAKPGLMTKIENFMNRV